MKKIIAAAFILLFAIHATAQETEMETVKEDDYNKGGFKRRIFLREVVFNFLSQAVRL